MKPLNAEQMAAYLRSFGFVRSHGVGRRGHMEASEKFLGTSKDLAPLRLNGE